MKKYMITGFLLISTINSAYTASKEAPKPGKPTTRGVLKKKQHPESEEIEKQMQELEKADKEKRAAQNK